MTGLAGKCGSEQCPLNPVLDGMREQAELQVRVNRMLWDNVQRLADLVVMRGCPPDICAVAAKGKR